MLSCIHTFSSSVVGVHFLQEICLSEFYTPIQHRKVPNQTPSPLLHHPDNTRPSGLFASANSTLRHILRCPLTSPGGLSESRNKCLNRRKNSENKRIYHIWHIWVCIQKCIHTHHIITTSVCYNKYPMPF